ncbi:MAG: hypothetical protein ACI9GB_002579, partial [Halioglobus sp.]
RRSGRAGSLAKSHRTDYAANNILESPPPLQIAQLASSYKPEDTIE